MSRTQLSRQSAQKPVLTTQSLTLALERLSSAKGEQDCAEALVSAATLMQTALLSGQDEASFQAAMDACSEQLGPQLSEVLSRAMDFQRLEDGSMLSLWLLPVKLSLQDATAACIDLLPDAPAALRLSGKLARGFGLQVDLNDPNARARGWVSVLPRLVPMAQMRSADLGELVKLPHRAKAMVRGQLPSVAFEPGQLDDPHCEIFMLPVMVSFSAGVEINQPEAAEDVRHALDRWIRASIPNGKEASLFVADRPEPFSLAITTGDTWDHQDKVHDLIEKLCSDTGVAPKAMAALLAGYQPSQGAVQETVVGLSVVSLLDGAVLTTTLLDVTGPLEDLLEEARVAVTAAGIQHVQVADRVVKSGHCHHCGQVQFLLPQLPTLNAAAAGAMAQ